jgi:hypothetical protein
LEQKIVTLREIYLKAVTSGEWKCSKIVWIVGKSKMHPYLLFFCLSRICILNFFCNHLCVPTDS